MLHACHPTSLKRLCHMVYLYERKNMWTTIFYPFVTCRACRKAIRKNGSLANYAYLKAKEGEIGSLPRGATTQESVDYWARFKGKRAPSYVSQVQKAVKEGAIPVQEGKGEQTIQTWTGEEGQGEEGWKA